MRAHTNTLLCSRGVSQEDGCYDRSCESGFSTSKGTAGAAAALASLAVHSCEATKAGKSQDLRKLFTAKQYVLRIKERLRESLRDGQLYVTSSWSMIESGCSS